MAAASTCLTLREIENELSEVTGEDWYPLGVQLRLRPPTLREIQDNYPLDTERCRREMLDLWLRSTSEASWRSLAQAVQGLGRYTSLAQKLRRKVPPAQRGELSSTTTGAHGRDASTESRHSVEEQSIPPGKRKCIRDEDTTTQGPGLPNISAGIAPPSGVLQPSGYQYLHHGGNGGHQSTFTPPQQGLASPSGMPQPGGYQIPPPHHLYSGSGGYQPTLQSSQQDEVIERVDSAGDLEENEFSTVGSLLFEASEEDESGSVGDSEEDELVSVGDSEEDESGSVGDSEEDESGSVEDSEEDESDPRVQEEETLLKETIRNNDMDSFHRHLDELERLLSGDDKMKRRMKSRALCFAAFVGSNPVVETLIHKGVDINTMSRVPEHPDDHQEMSPVHWAADKGHVNTVKCLIEKGAEVNSKDVSGRTPLHWAALSGHTDTIQCLTELGADINIKNDFGRTPLDLAALGGHKEVVAYLKRAADPNMLEESESTGRQQEQRQSPEETVAAAPTILAVEATSSTSISVKWAACTNDGGSPITSYVVEYRTALDPASPFETHLLGEDVFSTTLDGLAPSTEYEVRVRVENAVGRSQPSVAMQTKTKDNDTHETRTGKQILDEALENGYILCNIIKVLTLGAAGSGKTSTKYCLLREEPPSTRCSTPLAEASIRAISRALFGKDLTGWIRISPEKFMEMLADALIAGVPMEDQLEALRAGVEQLTKNLSEENLHKESVRIENGHRKKGHKKKPHKETPRKSTPSQPSPSSEQILRLVERSSGSKKFFEIQWINFIDSGGQPQFHELLPAFIRNTTVTMFVLKLSERLDQQPMIEYYKEGKSCGDALPCRLRNDQILQRCVQMIHSHPSSEGNLSHMMFVATHRDLEAECSETRADKNRKLLEMFRPHFRAELVYYHPFDELIFPINAKVPTEEDRKVAAMICEQITKFAPKPYKIPVGWFLLEQDIRMLADKGVISLQRCHDIANKLKINAEDLVPALNYLHELNILLYYPSLLPGVIFAEPQALLNKLTEVVAYSYKLRCGQINEPLTGEWIRFQDEGVVTFQMLQDERFSSQYIPGLFTPTHLVELFKGLLIFAPLTADEYFMPCLLPMLPAESITRPSSITTPLLVHFPSKCAQNGVFCALVVHLLAACKWELQRKDGNLACVFRNCIQFKLPGKPAIITLIDSFSFFEVHLRALPHPQILCEVRKSIFTGLENAYRKLKYNNSKPEAGFLCVCGSSPPHAATRYLLGGNCYLVCTETSECSGTISNEQEMWFGELPSTNTSGAVASLAAGSFTPQPSSTPAPIDILGVEGTDGITVLDEDDLHDVISAVTGLAGRWQNLGIALRLRQSDLDTILSASAHSPGDCLREMLILWLRQSYNVERFGKPTWRRLVEAVEDPVGGNNHALALKIAAEHPVAVKSGN